VRVIGEITENRLLARWGELLRRAPGQLVGLNEADAELVPLGDGRLLALTVDTVDEEVRAGLYREPRTIGRAAAVAALSDLAAVGADPLGLLLSVGLPARDRERVQEGIARGVREVVEAAGTFVLGGDTNDSETPTVSGFAAGLVPRESVLTRKGARPHWGLSGRVGGVRPSRRRRSLPASAGRLRRGDWRSQPRLREGGSCAARGRLQTPATASSPPSTRSPGSTAPRSGSRGPRRSARAGAKAVRARWPVRFRLPRRAPRRVRARLHRARGAPEGLARHAAGTGWELLAVGRVEAGEGLFLGSREIDGARVRNLLSEVGGDPVAYARALVGMAP
jgi:hypothetical protein